MKFKVKVIERKTGEVVEEKTFESERQKDAFIYWFLINGNVEMFYIEEEVEG